MTSMEYNGHRDKGHWNVSLWLANDEYLYRLAMCHISDAKRDKPLNWTRIASHRLFADLAGSRTPDGFKYTFQRIHAAIADLGE
jgi:hypothetical protein